ncbi:MAG: hypothetical protein ACJ76N_15610, partial [Thermoanaerobaculia bacterium]
LEPLLTGSDGYLRLRAATVLSSGGVDPARWLPALEPLLTGSDGYLRLRAAAVLSSGGVDPARWLPALESWLTGSATAQVSLERFICNQQILTESEGAFLYELLRKRKGDEKNDIRELLFDGLYQVAERRPTLMRPPVGKG